MRTAKGIVSKRKILVILAQFPDKRFTYSRSNFINMLTAPGYSENGATGSALDYFNDQFQGACDFEFTVSPIVTLSNGYAYYGQNDDTGFDERAPELVAEACRLASADIDFSEFDNDLDGEVDNIYIFAAGLSEAEGASSEYIWPHHWYLGDAGIRLSLDGKRINSYSISTEKTIDGSGKWSLTAIGTFCHEYSHSLGLIDHYDTDTDPYIDPTSGSGGLADCLWGSTDLMDHGNFNNYGNTPPNYNALELETLGIGTEVSLTEGQQSLPPLGSEKRYFRTEADKKGEYFLFECRDATGWDRYIGGSGMLIYHVDKSDNDSGYSDTYRQNLTAGQRWICNEINCRPDHQCLDLIEAVPIAKDVMNVFWPNGTHCSFAPNTTPSFKFWSGGFPRLSIIDIKKSGSGITFTVSGPLSIKNVEAFQDAAIVLWTSTSNADDCTVSISSSSGKQWKYTVQPYSTGCYSYTFEGLEPKATYQVTIKNEGSESSVVSTEFTTKPYYNDGYPFIYLNSAERNSDGSFIKGTTMPLRVFNAKNAARIQWQYNDATLSSDGSGYFKVIGNGTVKATVFYQDGSKEIISKTITVK